MPRKRCRAPLSELAARGLVAPDTPKDAATAAVTNAPSSSPEAVQKAAALVVVPIPALVSDSNLKLPVSKRRRSTRTTTESPPGGRAIKSSSASSRRGGGDAKEGTSVVVGGGGFPALPAAFSFCEPLCAVWDIHVDKESRYGAIQPTFLDAHPCVSPHMRAVLLDWLIEVCDENHLHRQSFYLSVAYLDRYLSLVRGVPKSDLQLLGVACLFIAAKLEEIYPPTVCRFADLTDGACTEDQILAQELEVLKVLHWELAPATPVAWVEIFLQCSVLPQLPAGGVDLDACLYSPQQFCQIAQLLDLTVLDASSVRFSPSVLAASSLFLVAGNTVDVFGVTGMSPEQISACVHWMKPYGTTIMERVGFAKGTAITGESGHIIQRHLNPFACYQEAAAAAAKAATDGSDGTSCETRGRGKQRRSLRNAKTAATL